jgi:hypothetical protein
MISELFWNAPTYYIGNPVITIFNGAQSWGSSATKTKVYSRGLPDLISRYARLGLSQESTKSIKKWANHMYGKTLLPQFNDPNQNPVLLFIKGIPAALSYPYLFPALWNSFIQSERSSFARNINRGIAGANRVGRYLFRDCRPARWFRGLIS